MSLCRDDVPDLVSEMMGGLPVRWATPSSTWGDYDGRERTLDVFRADAAEQLALLRLLRPERARLEATAGGPITIVFHTRAETRRLYPEMHGPVLRGYVVRVGRDSPAVRVRRLGRGPAGGIEPGATVTALLRTLAA